MLYTTNAENAQITIAGWQKKAPGYIRIYVKHNRCPCSVRNANYSEHRVSTIMQQHTSQINDVCIGLIQVSAIINSTAV